MFRLDSRGLPETVAGVPPDGFSAAGQLWGNPLYHWERHTSTGYRWWISRIGAALAQYDQVRLNHFHAYVEAWEVPARETVATRGRWIKTPGAELLARAEQAFGQLPLVADNLGLPLARSGGVAPQVGHSRNGHSVSRPSAADPSAAAFRPHHYAHNLVAVTGTHDTDTVAGWVGTPRPLLSVTSPRATWAPPPLIPSTGRPSGA